MVRANSIIVLLIVSFLALSLAVEGDLCSAEGWTMFHADPSRDGVGTGNPVLTPTFLWKNNITNVMDWSSPVEADGIVYISSTYDPSGYHTPSYHQECNILAFNATTGVQIWDYMDNSSTKMSTPVVANGIVFFSSFAFPNYIGALNAFNGASIWNFSGDAAFSSPVLAGNLLYTGDGTGIVYALNCTNGDKVWNTQSSANNAMSPPAYANGIVYIGSYDDNVLAFNSTNGKQIWNYTTQNYVWSAPAVVNGSVFLTDTHDVYALNADTGAKLWNYSTGLATVGFSSPAVAYGMVYVGSQRGVNSQNGAYIGSGNIYALDADTGAKIWNFSIGSNDILSSPAVVAGAVYVGTSDGNVYALNATNGQALWSYQTGSPHFSTVDSSPAVANGVLYIGSNDGNVYALGAPSAAVPLLSPSPSSPTHYTTFPAIITGVFVATAIVAIATIILILKRKHKQADLAPKKL